MASHNNCRALVPADRQFSDEQIQLLVQRNAVVGVVCDAWMLRPRLADWRVATRGANNVGPGRSHRPHLPIGG